MRLLHTKTKQLTTFYGEDIPEYAILSHMWRGEEDEVLFRHITGSDTEKREGEMRKGYAKIEGACKQAIKDGFAYIWIDTCCIDKASSAELSEAINSMYEWYRKSRVCYVYLEDVRSGGDGQAENDQNVLFPIVSFEHSRWFSRGWTLQELIAPKSVVFFSKDWVDIGTKNGLRDTISAVTRIRVEMLTAYDPEKASVAEKMSWAAFRETTRVEDVAYSMMGLLGVNMPLLYGEGNKAFMRLQEEFMKGSDDDSLFAWKSRIDDYRDHLDDTRGMLAASPWEFRDGMNIVRSDDGAYSSYSITNQGLKIKLPLLPIDLNQRKMIGTNSENIFKAILKCTIRDGKLRAQRIVIYLERIREGRYQRILPHWLDETEVPPNGTKLTSLLVPQAQVNTKSNNEAIFLADIEIEILPTISVFTLSGDSLIEGQKRNFSNADADGHCTEVIFFENEGKRFGVAVGMVIGSNYDVVPWLDFIDIIDEIEEQPLYYYKYSYGKEGSRAHLRERYLDRLSKRIPGEDWWVTVSVKRKYNDRHELHAIIDIQREPIRAKGWYIPPAILTSDTLFNEQVSNYPDHHDVHPDFKKEGYNWSVMFNPNMKRVLDVNLVYTHRHDDPSNNCGSSSNSTFMTPSHEYFTQLSHDGKYLAMGNKVVQIYNTETGAKICTFSNDTSIHSMRFSPDSNFVAVGHHNRCIKLWDINKQRSIVKVLPGDSYDNPGTVDLLCFSPNGHLIISGSLAYFSVDIWRVADGALRIIHCETYLKSIAISPNGSFLAIIQNHPSYTGLKRTIQIWDVLTTQLLEQFEHGDSDNITFTPDGRGLVSSSTDKTLKYWNLSGLAPTVISKGTLRNLRDSGDSRVPAASNIGKIPRHTMTFRGHKKPVTSVAVSHDGRWVITQSSSERGLNNTLFWDLKNATPQFVLETPKPINHWKPSFSTSPAGNIFTTISESDTHEIAQIWRYDNTEPQTSSNQFLMRRHRPKAT